jgi:hypothetical protein
VLRTQTPKKTELFYAMSLQKPIILYVLGYTISDASSRILYQCNPLSLGDIPLNATT